MVQIGEMVDLEVQENNLFYTAKDIQGILGCGKNKVYAIINMNGFPKIRIGKQFYIPKSEFYKWINKNVYNNLLL